MNLHKAILAPAAALALAVCGANALLAGDNQFPPPMGSPNVGPYGAYGAPPYGAPPAGYGAPYSTQYGPGGGCPSCGGGSFSGGSGGCKSCESCGGSWLHHHDKGPFVVNLCPGACFGYFQTQWRKWDDVCPYPYQGIGVSDAPRPPSPVIPGPTTAPGKSGTTIPGPRPVPSSDSKPMSHNGYPTIPVPGNGY
jgi:hypothetical protein